MVFFAIGLGLQGAVRLWTFTAFWTIYLTIVGLGVSFIQLQFFGPNLCRVSTDQNRIALTFDDGPDPAATPALLDLLARENISATFFCIGKKVDAHSELTKRIANEGHLLANHTYSHHWWTPLLGRRELTSEITKTQDSLARATGITATYFRPPVGLTNPNYVGILRRLNLQMIGWDVRSMDTRWDAKRVIQRVLTKTRSGSIILLHDGASSPERVIKIVGTLIGDLKKQGYQFERLDRLVSDASGAANSLAAKS